MLDSSKRRLTGACPITLPIGGASVPLDRHDRAVRSHGLNDTDVADAVDAVAWPVEEYHIAGPWRASPPAAPLKPCRAAWCVSEALRRRCCKRQSRVVENPTQEHRTPWTPRPIPRRVNGLIRSCRALKYSKLGAGT